MSARRLAVVAAGAALALASGGACDKTSACKQGTLFLTVALAGNAMTADELRIDVMTQDQASRQKTFPHQSGTGGGTIQIEFPEGYEQGKTTVVIVGAFSTSGDKLAVGSVTVVLASGCSSAMVALTDTADGGAPPCNAGEMCTPGSGSEPCGLFTIDCSAGTPVCQRTGVAPPGTPCSGGVCSAGTCVGCQTGGECVPADAPCKLGALACSTGTPACTAGASNRPDGYGCGTNRVCKGGACTDCVANQSCTPPAGNCVNGITSCTSGSSMCQPTTPIRAGESCGSNRVCNGGGGCIACQQGLACTPANNCRVGTLDCATGSGVCTETTQTITDGIYCAKEKLCAAGACAAAGNWITRGEDSRTATGGYVYTFFYAGGSIMPDTTPGNVAFPPTAGGVTGKALMVMGSIPPEDPPNNNYPGAGLGMTLTEMTGSIDAASRGSGIQFQVKASRPMAITVSGGDIWVSDAFPNCTKTPTASSLHVCFQYPVALCNVTAADAWTTCRFVWSDFRRPNYGNLGDGLPLDSSALTDLQFKPPPTPVGSPALSYQFWIDDISFVP